MQDERTLQGRVIPLVERDGTYRGYALVDEPDYVELAQYRWRLHGAGYACRGSDGILMHRQILGLPSQNGHGHKGRTLEVDHINRDKLDNRRSNLRLVTRSENLANRAGYGRSQHKGIHWDGARGKWRASAGRLVIGRFDTEGEAVAALEAFQVAGGTVSPGGFVGTILFVVPRGAPVHSMRTGEWTPAFRKQVIDLAKPGCTADRYGDGEWVVITWPGSGGYWRRVVQRHGEFVAEWPS